MVKNPPAIQEIWVRSLGWRDPLKEGMGTHSNILAQRIPVDRGTWQATVHGVAKRVGQDCASSHRTLGRMFVNKFVNLDENNKFFG